MQLADAEGAVVDVELLYFDGCPNHEALVPHLERLLRSVQVPVTLELRRIPDEAAAQREGFLGSPSVRVAGRDIEPGAEQRGAPLDDWVLDALTRPSA